MISKIIRAQAVMLCLGMVLSSLLLSCSTESNSDKINRLLEEGNVNQAYTTMQDDLQITSDLSETMKKANSYAMQMKQANAPQKAIQLFQQATDAAEKIIATNPQDKDLRSEAEMISLASRMQILQIKKQSEKEEKKG